MPLKVKMTVDDAIAFADEWIRGCTIHEGSQGWRVACALLADEVRRLRGILTPIAESSAKAKAAGRKVLDWVEYAKALEADSSGAASTENERLRKRVLQLEAERDALCEAAIAVVQRWDTPLWKDVPATAVYINRLRNAL